MGGGPIKDVLLCALPFAPPPSVINALQQKFPSIEVISHQVASARAAAEDASVVSADIWQRTTILVTLFTFPEPSQVPKLQLVHLISAGSNQLQGKPLYTDTDVIITTSSGVSGPQIAEWMFMSSLVITHKYNALYEMQKKHAWGGSDAAASQTRQVRDWVGRRIGILGYGSIGRQVGRIAQAMGGEVIAYTASAKDTPEQKRDHGFVIPGTGDLEGTIPRAWYSGLDKRSLHTFLAQDLDWLLIAVPLTDQTRHFLSTAEFHVLSDGGKRPVFVTNIARGAIVDQPALIAALKDRTLAGACLDVTDPEPLPADSELWDLENVIVTPHVSGNSEAYTERVFQLLTANLERREKGESLFNVVRRSRGY